MGRLPKIEIADDGSATLRTTFGPHMWRLVQRHAKRIGVNDAQCANMLLIHLEALAYDSALGWLPADWQHTHKEQRKEAGNRPPSLMGIDLTVLHRSNKTKSGFVGVYVNGSGYRAIERRGNYLGTFDSAEEAAYQRYLFYKRNKLPYGELEVEVDKRRNEFGEQGTDQEITERLLHHAAQTGQMHFYAPWIPKDDPSPTPRAAPSPQQEASPTTGPVMLGFEGVDPAAALARLRAKDAEDIRREKEHERRDSTPREDDDAEE
jgi:hypothetical protein